MRIPGTWNFTAAAKEYSQELLARIIGDIGGYLELVQRALNGNITFGDGTDYDNIKGQWATFTSDAVANTEFAVAHTLGEIPIGYLVFSADKAGVLYRGTTTWTTSSVYLKCNVASTTFTIFLILGPTTT